MKILVFAIVFAAACGGTQPVVDNDLGTPMDLTAPAGSDLAMTGGDGGGLPFGAPCTMDGQCATGHCFIGGMMTFCTMPCTAATQATDCPVPPTSGMCNMKGFCKP